MTKGHLLPLPSLQGAAIALVMSLLFGCGGDEVPESIRLPGVRLADGNLVKSVRLAAPELGLVHAIRQQPDAVISAGDSVCVATGSHVRCSPVRVDFWSAVIVPGKGLSDTIIVGDRASARSFAAVRLDGTYLWTARYTTALPIMELVTAPDGEPSVLLGDVVRGAVLIDPRTGVVRREVSHAADDCSAGNLVGDERAGIVCFEEAAGGEGRLAVRDHSGKLIVRTPIGAVDFEVAQVRDGRGELAVVDQNAITFFNGKIKATRRLPLPDQGYVPHLAGIAIISRGGQPAVVSLWTGRGSWDRSTLLIHHADGSLVYHEVLDTRAASLEPIEDGFLVGARGRVYKYAFKDRSQ